MYVFCFSCLSYYISKIEGELADDDDDEQDHHTMWLSPENIVEWLTVEQENQRASLFRTKANFLDYTAPSPTKDLGDVTMSWTIVFKLTCDDKGLPTLDNQEEIWSVATRLHEIGVVTQHQITSDGSSLLLMFGLPYKVLIEEATFSKRRMRLAECRGTIEFDERYLHYYRTAPDGSAFVSSDKQVLAMERVQRMPGVDLLELYEQSQQCVKKEDLLNFVRSRIQHRTRIRSNKLKSLLTAYGAFRPGARKMFGEAVHRLTIMVEDNPFFQVCTPEDMTLKGMVAKQSCMEHGDAHGYEAVVYDEMEEVLKRLELWSLGEGADETTTGTLLQYFPNHCQEELEPLLRWGSLAAANPFSNFWVQEKEVEGEDGLAMGRRDIPLVGQFGPLYQPIDEVRDYFGDSIGMYFSFLGYYTRALVVPAIFGIMVETTSMTIYDGVDKNPLTLAYSFFLAIWSVTFQSGWTGKQTGLVFLWGSEGIRTAEKPRRAFKGVLTRNDETNREELVVPSERDASLKMLFAWTLITITMGITLLLAFCSAKISLLPPKGDSLLEQKTPMIISACANLGVLMIAQVLFEQLAFVLNQWQNYRTQGEWEDAFVVKNAVFQFFNNYFYLFYIAYLVQMRDPIWDLYFVCERSCLPLLQFKILFILSGTMFGKKIGQFLAPIAANRAKATIRNLAATQRKMDIKRATRLEKKEQKALHKAERKEEKAHHHHEEPPALLGRNKSVLSANMIGRDISEYEDQSYYEQSDGIFDDYSELIVQYGYVALFAPACPLGPALAVFNNLLEIRFDSRGYCRTYKRAAFERCDGIGSWAGIMKVIAIVA